MAMKNEALKLADELKEKYGHLPIAYMQDAIRSEYTIRKLVAELDRKEKSDTSLHPVPLSDVKQSLLSSNENISQKPLTYEEIRDIWYQYEKVLAVVPVQFARAIEERHGIK